MSPSVFLTGLSMGLSLIVAIGAQNAFVLRQGIRGEHVFWVSLSCALSDLVLIVVGVTGFSALSLWLPQIAPLMRFGGAAFLIWYGFRSLRAALGPAEALAVTGTQEGRVQPLSAVLGTCLVLTWGNPHVYLDTVVLLGTVAARFPGAQGSFAAGAVTGSFLFFFALGYGARFLRPVFARPLSWRILEAGIAIVMWAIALRLLIEG